MNAANSAVTLPAREFERHRIRTEVEVTFSMFELRTIVMFADSFALPIDIYFDKPGRWVTVEIC